MHMPPESLIDAWHKGHSHSFQAYGSSFSLAGGKTVSTQNKNLIKDWTIFSSYDGFGYKLSKTILLFKNSTTPASLNISRWK